MSRNTFLSVRIDDGVLEAADGRLTSDKRSRAQLVRGFLRYYATGGALPKALEAEIRAEGAGYSGTRGVS